MSTIFPYRYDNQFEKYLEQTMRAFSGFQVRESGTNSNLQRVPVRYGSMSRIVASVLQRRDSYTNTSLPLLALNLRSINPAPERKVSHHHQEAITIPDEDGNLSGVRKVIGPSFDLDIELGIYADSQTQLFEIMEQILLIFNPRITIQVDNSVINSDYLTEISLTSIDNEIQYPLGTDNQSVMQTLSFNVPVRLHLPHYEGDNIIEEIRVRVFDDTGDSVIKLDDYIVDENT